MMKKITQRDSLLPLVGEGARVMKPLVVFIAVLVAPAPANAYLAYVSNEKGNSITIIDTDTLQAIKTVKVGRRLASAIEIFPPLHLRLFALNDLFDVLVGDSQLLNHSVVQNPRCARNCAHG